MHKLKLFILTGSMTMFAACGQTATNNTVATNAKPVTNAAPTLSATPATVTGSKLFADNCAKCHRDNGVGGKITIEGKTLNPDNLTTDKLAAKSDEKVYGYISDGAPDDGMPAFKDKLKDTDIKEIIKFIRSDLHKPAAK